MADNTSLSGYTLIDLSLSDDQSRQPPVTTDAGSFELTLPPSGPGFKIRRDGTYAKYNGEVEFSVDGKEMSIRSDYNLSGTRHVVASAQLKEIGGSSDLSDWLADVSDILSMNISDHARRAEVALIDQMLEIYHRLTRGGDLTREEKDCLYKNPSKETEYPTPATRLRERVETTCWNLDREQLNCLIQAQIIGRHLLMASDFQLWQVAIKVMQEVLRLEEESNSMVSIQEVDSN